MKKNILLVLIVFASQVVFSQTTYNCKIQEPTGETHSIEVRPSQIVTLGLSSLTMHIELKGSESSDELDYVTAVAKDMITADSEGGLIASTTELSNSKGQSVSISCTSK